MNNIVGYTSCKNVQTSKIIFYMSPYEIPDLYEEIHFYIVLGTNVEFVNNTIVSEHCVLSQILFRNDMLAFITDGIHCFPNGNIYNYKNAVLHSENDLPAIETINCKKWMKEGVLHRDNDLPAIETINCKKWMKEGVLHRDNDLPAIDDTLYGVKYWYNSGKLHRENDLPAIVHIDGSKHWYKNGLRHRENEMPASIYPNEDISEWYNYNIFVKRYVGNPIVT